MSTIWVGGDSEIEIREKKARVEDAVEAVRSTVEEGIIPGGCVTNLRLITLLARHKDSKSSWEVLGKALMAPLELLLTNCGEDPKFVSDMLIDKTKHGSALPKWTFDAVSHKLVNPWKKGILEPAKVMRVSIGNAISVATLLITLGGMVVVPRNTDLETQMALADKHFSSMMEQVNE